MTVLSKELDKVDAQRAEHLRKQEQMFPPPIPYDSKARRGKIGKSLDSED